MTPADMPVIVSDEPSFDFMPVAGTMDPAHRA